MISIPLYIYICACCGSPEKQNKAAAVELGALKLPGRAAEGRRGRGMAQPRCIPAPGRARLPVPLREHSSSFLNWIKMFLYSTCITVRLFKLDRLLSSCKNTSGKWKATAKQQTVSPKALWAITEQSPGENPKQSISVRAGGNRAPVLSKLTILSMTKGSSPGCFQGVQRAKPHKSGPSWRASGVCHSHHPSAILVWNRNHLSDCCFPVLPLALQSHAATACGVLAALPRESLKNCEELKQRQTGWQTAAVTDSRMSASREKPFPKELGSEGERNCPECCKSRCWQQVRGTVPCSVSALNTECPKAGKA